MEQETHKPERDSLLKIIARFFKYNKFFMLFIAILLMIVYMTLFGSKGLMHRISLESEKKDLEGQLKTETQRTGELQKEIEKLNNSDERIEEVAREKYGLTKEGEKIYKITVDSTK